MHFGDMLLILGHLLCDMVSLIGQFLLLCVPPIYANLISFSDADNKGASELMNVFASDVRLG